MTSQSSNAVTGPGRSLWRDSTFLRMSLRLFNYFATEHMEETSILHERKGLASTSADQLRHKSHTNISMSPIPMRETIQNVTYEELNKQVNTLSDVVKTLQGQISKIQDFMSELDKKKLTIKNSVKTQQKFQSKKSQLS